MYAYAYVWLIHVHVAYAIESFCRSQLQKFFHVYICFEILQPFKFGIIGQFKM